MSTEKILSFFGEIARIPRESGHEEKIVAYLQQFAKERSLDCRTDAVGNVVISKPASKGYEGRPGVILQGHTDMVCEKVAGSSFDFSKDAIRYEIEDGWMIAKETTLGADNGIGVATALAILDDDSIEHPDLECLFTVSEETGLDGARALTKDFVKGKTLINMDDEDEGYFCIGCAGGMDTVGTFTFKEKKMPEGAVATRFSIENGLGGHSGDDIDKNRMNAVQQIARFVNRAFSFGVDICSISAGNKRNAIARNGEVVLAIPARKEDEVVALFNCFASELKSEFAVTDPGITFSAEPVNWNGPVMDGRTSGNLVRALLALPHGVIAMSAEIPGLIQTSTNLASVKQEGGKVVVGTMQRSSVNSEREFLSQRIAAVFEMAGAEAEFSDGYCGWKPNVDSAVKDVCVAAYEKLFKKTPVVRAIHAGLECGLFTEKFPDMDMIAFGPTLQGVHAPGEKLDLASLERFYAVLQEVIKNIE
ncbi:MAG: aminoacyl-histidine dipeptidase [Bacteroidales bacterium]|nr:aminoacyl-histidine dipeptidase [Candidatus Cacconaster merdequi]